MLQFVQILKYPPVTAAGGDFAQAGGPENFALQLTRGNRTVIYPLMFYLLSKLEQLEKRAYLARFLVNIDVPQEFMISPEVQEVYKHYKEQQKEFAETHRQVDQLRGSTLAPGDLQGEIKQLSEEREQLRDKIESMKRKTQDLRGFRELHEVTSELRKEQEAEAKLQERRAEQTSLLIAAEQRYEMASRMLEEQRRVFSRDASAEDILAQVQRESDQLRSQTEVSLPSALNERQTELARLQEMLSEPAKTQADVESIAQQVRMLDSEVDRQKRVLEEARLKMGSDALEMYRKQASLVAKKVEQKEAQLENAQAAKSRLQKSVEAAEQKLSSMPGVQAPGGKDFRTFAQELRGKTMDFRQKKRVISELQREGVVLSRTEAILKSRCDNLEEVLSKIERRAGVSGYMNTQQKLESVTTSTAALNQNKGKTLEEISKIVTDISATLNTRKNRLAPKIKRLRSVRQEFQEIDAEYQEKKNLFENTAAGLESERIRLDRECGELQHNALEQESQYHLLQCLSVMKEATVERVEMEQRYKKGEGELLPEFKTFESLYQHKIDQQKVLNAQIRKQHSALEGNAPQDRLQRALFQQLYNLLDRKLHVCRSGKNNAAAADGGAKASFDEYGGTNIMTLQTDSP